MFPIFLWVEEYKGFKNFQINLDNEYECNLEIGKGLVTVLKEDKDTRDILKIKEVEHEKKNSLVIENLTIKKTNKTNSISENFYGKNIENMKIIVGRNGTGKSSILEFLTLDNKRDYNYLLIFKPNQSKDKDNEKLFYVEGNLPALFSKEALNFIKNKNKVPDLTNVFTFYMNIDSKVVHLAQYDHRTGESLIGKIKYSENKRRTRNDNRDNIEIERFNSSYNMAYEYLYLFLNGISLKEILKELLSYDNPWINNYYKQYIKFYNIIEKNNYFESDTQVFEIEGEIKSEVQEFLKQIDFYHSNNVDNEVYKFFEIKNVEDFLSDGEKTFVSLFSTIHYFVTAFGNKEEGEKIWLRKKYITLMFDEPDLYLHPEWCRIFLSKLFEVIKTYSEIELYKEMIFNLIIVTHSPYMLSDTMNEDVIYLSKDQKGYPVVEKKVNKTFGANIMELYKDSFFMESTFGEFAKNKIQNIIEELSGEKSKISAKRKEVIWEIIQMIGENLIRRKLENMYYEYFKEDKIEQILAELNELSEKQRKKILNSLVAEAKIETSKKDRY